MESEREAWLYELTGEVEADFGMGGLAGGPGHLYADFAVEVARRALEGEPSTSHHDSTTDDASSDSGRPAPEGLVEVIAAWLHDKTYKRGRPPRKGHAWVDQTEPVKGVYRSHARALLAQLGEAL